MGFGPVRRKRMGREDGPDGAAAHAASGRLGVDWADGDGSAHEARWVGALGVVVVLPTSSRVGQGALASRTPTRSCKVG